MFIAKLLWRRDKAAFVKFNSVIERNTLNFNISYNNDIHKGELFSNELRIEKSFKIFLLGLTCNFIFVHIL